MRGIVRFGLWVMLMATVGSAESAEKTGMDGIRLMNEGKTKEALAVFEGLAAKGDDKAMIQLGIYYYEGKKVKQDYSQALDWWIKALNKDNANAFVNLGVLYRDGLGVPKNKKIAYCVFLTTHMAGLGTQGTQMRANRNLRKVMKDMTNDDLKDCLSNYTLPYVLDYLKAKGKMKGIPDKYKPTDKVPAFKDLGWWAEGELDAVFGPPTEAEKKARLERKKRREAEMAALQHTLVVQVRFPKGTAAQYRWCEFITDQGISSSPIKEDDLKKHGDSKMVEKSTLVWAENHRFVDVKNKDGEIFVFKIPLPTKVSPKDWGKWLKPDYATTDESDVFRLLQGAAPKGKLKQLPAKIPELRFKVVKE